MKVRRNATVTALAAVLVLTISGPAAAPGSHSGGHGGGESAGGHGHGGGESTGGHGHGGGESAGGHGHGGHSFPFGRPASASQADRTVEIAAKDDMSYAPSSIQVQAGETVQFVVKNTGSLPHSFTLATPHGQREHQQSMQGMPMEKLAGHIKDEPNGMVLQPGERRTLTWRFKDSGKIQFACHIPGHFQAGMKGQIRVQ